ncbi:MAG: hypothetical protein FJ098_12815, partial [Deltaproteobacteria bacterium]|nr:hypothetical protein [Deltaproteobacteria bacterium]
MEPLRLRLLLLLLPGTVALCLPQLSTFQLAKALLAGPFLACLFALSGGGPRRPAGPVSVAALLLLLTGLAALARSPAPGDAAWELWLDLLLLAAVAAGASLGPEGRRRLPSWIAVAGAVAAGVTGLEALGLKGPCPSAVPGGGTMGNPNFAGAVLGLAAPATLWLALDERTRRGRVLLGLLLGGQVAALLGLGSWTGMTAAGAGLLVTGGLALRARGRPVAAVGLALVGLALGALALLGGDGLDHLAARSYMARVSLDAAAAHPVGGAGLGGFPRAFLDSQAAGLAEHPELRGLWTRALHAHCEPLHALVERGPAGLLAWIALWASAAWQLRRRWRLSNREHMGVHSEMKRVQFGSDSERARSSNRSRSSATSRIGARTKAGRW